MSKVNRTVLHESVPTYNSFKYGGTVRTALDVFADSKGLYWQYTGELPHTVQPDTQVDTNWIPFNRENLLDSDASALGYKHWIEGAVKRTVQSKLSDTLSVLDFGVVGDGVVDDTKAFRLAVRQANDSKCSLYIPSSCLIRITETCPVPNLGIHGDNRVSSGIVVDINTTDSSTVGLVFNPDGNWGKGYSGAISNLVIKVPDDSESSVSLLEINTPSMGSSMHNVSFSTRYGYCVRCINFFYYYFDNVVFTGKWFPEPVSAGTAFRGTGLYAPDAINNTYFNKCDFRFLEYAFKGAGAFKGSNNLKFDECVFETLGHHLGDITSWNAVFSSCYIEHLWRNEFEKDKWVELICKAGTADITFDDNTLFNFAGAPKDKPCFTAYLCTITLDCVKGGLPADYTSTVINPITYSSRAVLCIHNSGGFNQSGGAPAYVNDMQQFVQGYPNAGAGVVSPVIASSSVANRSLCFNGEYILNRKDVPEISEGYVVVPDNVSAFITLESLISVRKHSPHNNCALLHSSTLFWVDSTSTGTIEGTTITNNKEDTGSLLDSSSWLNPYFLQLASTSGGFKRYAIKRRTKNSTDYFKDVSCTLNVQVQPSVKNARVGITPVF